jgi:dihydropteroate synthase
MHWQTSRFNLDLTTPKIMGIVNTTPDSFSDGGRYHATASALAHCEQLIRDGADILDIGGESSRPGAQIVPLEEELARVIPVLRHAVTLGVPISVDTYKPEVMQAVLDCGADIINDIWALRQGNAAEVVSRHPSCGVCLMHMHREPRTMQQMPMEDGRDVVTQVLLFLKQTMHDLQALGVDLSRICVDPGIGFGKTVTQNFTLLAQQRRFADLGCGILAGWSRKSSLAAVTGVGSVADRLVPSVTAALLAVQNGAQVVRVHDVKETVQALRVFAAMKEQK